MSIKDLRHSIVAVAYQWLSATLLLWWVPSMSVWAVWTGYGALAAGFYIGREVAQAEHRCIQWFYGNKRANAPWYCGLEPRAWNVKSFWWDMTLPAICVTLATVIASV